MEIFLFILIKKIIESEYKLFISNNNYLKTRTFAGNLLI